MRSSRRPGVATRMCERAAFWAWPWMPTPPKAVATRRPLERASAAVSSATCMASSRVGTSTRPAGTLASREMRSTMGIANAIVLPLPVGDLARTSRPARASGRTSSWIGKGAEMPRCASAAQTCSDAPRARKDFVLNVQLLAVCAARSGAEEPTRAPN